MRQSHPYQSWLPHKTDTLCLPASLPSNASYNCQLVSSSLSFSIASPNVGTQSQHLAHLIIITLQLVFLMVLLLSMLDNVRWQRWEEVVVKHRREGARSGGSGQRASHFIERVGSNVTLSGGTHSCSIILELSSFFLRSLARRMWARLAPDM